MNSFHVHMIDFHWQVELWKKLHKKTNETKSEGLTNEVSGVLKILH